MTTMQWTDEELLRQASSRTSELEDENERLREQIVELENERDELQDHIAMMIHDIELAIR